MEPIAIPTMDPVDSRVEAEVLVELGVCVAKPDEVAG